jgi:hypothetical protein
MFLLFILYSSHTGSQNLEQINSAMIFKDRCFSDRIKSVKLYRSDSQINDPVINLYSSETVTLVFDELLNEDEDESDYYYTVEHCDADWANESLLLQNEYMDGFKENSFDRIFHSQNTRINYRHFHLDIPNSNVRLKISGNYFVKVFDRKNSNLVLQKGFSVVEPVTSVNASFLPKILSDCSQQLDIKVKYNTLHVADAYSNLKLRIEQNSTRVPGSKIPVVAFSYPQYADYTRTDKNKFGGFNEFRSFDTRSLMFNGEGVAGRYINNNEVFEVSLTLDNVLDSYTSTKDINGKYMIASEYATFPEIQSDYAEVIFTLSANILIEGRLFLFGELTNYSLSDKYELKFENNIYRCKALLKQGYYNYRYVIVKPNGEIDMSRTDGCFFETKNAYGIYVYYRSQENNRCDHLVGFSMLNSK